MLRSLTWHWRINLAVTLAAAVATSVLTGALVVGDSVRDSLRDLTLERLGRIERALVTERWFREGLADDVSGAARAGGAGAPAAVPAVLLRGSAVSEAGARASGVNLAGVDARFAGLFDGVEAEALRTLGERAEGQLYPSAAINASLARELGVGAGDAVVLGFMRHSRIPRDTLMGDKDPDDVLARLRVSVTDVLPDRGAGRFGLLPDQATPFNVFVDLSRLQRALDHEGSVNALLLATGSPAGDPDAALARRIALEDLGLGLDPGPGYFQVESEAFVLRPDVVDAVEAVAGELGTPVMRIQTYLANALVGNGRLVPYSMVAALDPPGGAGGFALKLRDGSPAPVPSDGGILLNTWTARELQVGVGDAVEMAYWVVGPREELATEETELTVEGVVAMEGLADDRSLVPDFPGIQEADDISAWDPPFPVDLRMIRDEDETYWDEHGATPKAFVSEATGSRLWTTRFGSTTAVRVGAAPGASVAETEARFRRELLARLDPGAFGFRFRNVRGEGLEAAAGATDFAGLFLGFSLFLIVSSAMLVGLLFALGVDGRAREIGLLRAVGYRVRSIRASLLAEAVVLGAVGAALGTLGGVGYAGLMMVGLRTWWLPAVGSSQLVLHVRPATLATGGAIALAVVLVSVTGTLVRLGRVAPPALLARSTRAPARRRRRRMAAPLAVTGFAGAAGLVVFAWATGRFASPGLAFGTGTLLLVAGLASFATWCRGERRRRVGLGPSALAGMAARNSAWSPGRSMLSVALVASACFVIVAVAANRLELGDRLRDRRSGSGGFALVAESDVPLHQSLNRPEGRRQLGFSDEASARLEGVAVYGMRLLPGEDASCLNLYRPEKPRVVGVPPEMIDRGGFAFQGTLGLAEGESNPWRLLDEPSGPGVIPAFADANSAQWILHLGLGDDVVIEDELGETVRLRLVGLLAGSLFQSEVLISEERFLEHFPGRTGHAFFLIDAPFARTGEVSAALESTLGPFGFDAVTTLERLERYKSVEHTYLSTFQALGGLGLLLGTVGLGVVLVRNVVERRGELATLRAFGFRRATLAWLVLAENAFLLITGMLVGTGAALAAVLPRLAVIRMPWTSLLTTLAVVLVVGMLASTVAVLGALRTPLLPTLKSD